MQTGSFSSVPTADYIDSIKKLGLPYTTEYTDKYKVLVGPYNNESSARTSLAKVRKHINGGAFLVNNKSNMKSKGATLY